MIDPERPALFIVAKPRDMAGVASALWDAFSPEELRELVVLIDPPNPPPRPPIEPHARTQGPARAAVPPPPDPPARDTAVTRWLDTLTAMLGKSVSPGERDALTVAHALADYVTWTEADDGQTTAHVCVSVARLTDALSDGMDADAVGMARSLLARLGFLRLVRPSGGGRPNEYTLTVPNGPLPRMHPPDRETAE